MDDTTPWHLSPPAFAEIEEATARIRGVLRETPLLESERLNRRLGGRLLVKAEGLQVTGSFKARGAWNRLSQLTPEERGRGVAAFSSGNHGQAVAWASSRLGVRRAVVAMPSDAPAMKIEGTRGWGGEVVLFDRHDPANADRATLGQRLAAEGGLTLVPPFDDRRIVAGAGTLGAEVVRQAAEMGAEPDALVLCCGGGGLTAGCALAWEVLRPGSEVWAAEPEGFDDTALSIAKGRRVGNAPEARSICDAILTPMPGVLTFAINAPRLGGVAVVTDAAVREAMRVAFAEFELVVEPGGAAALAAVLAGGVSIEGRCIAVALTGANVDLAAFASMIG
jgi:threonine dehydratase